uniref:Uncharacterized protein n=1 Tax=Oryza rufipogon TaxID=4529 RepID=A0A0E0NNI9_ORYRU
MDAAACGHGAIHRRFGHDAGTIHRRFGHDARRGGYRQSGDDGVVVHRPIVLLIVVGQAYENRINHGRGFRASGRNLEAHRPTMAAAHTDPRSTMIHREDGIAVVGMFQCRMDIEWKEVTREKRESITWEYPNGAKAAHVDGITPPAGGQTASTSRRWIRCHQRTDLLMDFCYSPPWPETPSPMDRIAVAVASKLPSRKKLQDYNPGRS